MSDRLPRLQPLEQGNAETCEYVGPEGVFWSKGARISFSKTLNSSLTPVANIPLSGIRSMLAATRIGRRLSRQTLYNLLPINDGSLFYSFGPDIGYIRDGCALPISGRKRQTKILRGGLARLPDGDLVFGEYFSNADRAAVHLYRWRPGESSVNLLYTFEAGEVRHIHSVSWDPFVRRAVVATGDIGDECRLLSFDIDFEDLQILGRGDERWRTISPQFSKEAIYFGTDAEFDQNHIYRYDRATGSLSPLGDVNGPVFYSVRLGEGWIFATTAELCLSQSSPTANLYYLDERTETVSVIASFLKDRWPKKYFQFGILNFPILGRPTDSVPVSGTALKGLDGRFVLIEK